MLLICACSINEIIEPWVVPLIKRNKKLKNQNIGGKQRRGWRSPVGWGRNYEVGDLRLQPTSVLNLCHLHQLFKLSVTQFPRYVQLRNNTLSFHSLNCPVYLACQMFGTWIHLSQHSSFDRDVWLTQIIDANNKNQKCLTLTFLRS